MAQSVTRYFQLMAAQKSKPSRHFWYPAADVYQTFEGWSVVVELAGVSAEDIEIEIEGNCLYISGMRRDMHCKTVRSCHQMEITYSRFEKSLDFPASIQGATVEHNFDNGLLIINLRK